VGVGIKVKNGNFFRGIILRVGTTFLTLRTNNNKVVIIRIANIIDIDLGEVGAQDALKIANRLVIVRPINQVKTAIFVRVGRDFVEFITINPDEANTLYFREIVPCSQVSSLECVLKNCIKNSNTTIKCKCRSQRARKVWPRSRFASV
jgi:hypothetical protein